MTNQELIQEFRESDYVSFTEFLDQYEWVEVEETCEKKELDLEKEE